MSKKKDRRFILLCLLPALLCIVFLFLYPVSRTLVMSFFTMSNFMEGIDGWHFVGFDNFRNIFGMTVFVRSMRNLALIWVVGGIFTLSVSLFYAAAISSGVKAKAFWRSIVYLPNIINMVALATMWTQYIYSGRFGLLTTVFSTLGLETLAATQWTGEHLIFWTMLFAFSLGCVGFYMLIFLAGIEGIPAELHESAYIEGAGRTRSFFLITLPLLRGIIRTSLTLWTITAANFFVWAMIFTQGMNLSTVVPGVLMYNLVFGSISFGAGMQDPGAGAAVGVIVAISVMLAYTLLMIFVKDRKVEF